jgi:hypothetical protein
MCRLTGPFRNRVGLRSVFNFAPRGFGCTQPIRILLIGSDPWAIYLSKDGMEFERRPSKRQKPNVRVSALKVIRFSQGATRDKKTSPRATCHVLEFSEKTSYGKKIRFCANADQVGTLFQYLQQAGPPGMSWQ